MNWRQIVYEAVKKIPKGKVSTYGNIAKHIKVSPRMVGWALHNNPDPKHIPCHRVVDRNGKLAENYAFGGWKGQKKKLLAEGIRFKKNGRVDLDMFSLLLNSSIYSIITRYKHGRAGRTVK